MRFVARKLSRTQSYSNKGIVASAQLRSKELRSDDWTPKVVEGRIRNSHWRLMKAGSDLARAYHFD